MPDRNVCGGWTLLCAAALGLTGCAGGTSDSPVEAPGSAKTPTTATLEAGARIMQDKPPLRVLNTYHDGFHFYNGRMSGQLIAPGIPQAAETRLMENLVSTYGKTWHTWHTEQGNALPYGVPQLMMGFTADGQVDPQLVRERDGRMGVDSEAKKRARAGIQAPVIDPGADAWQKGQVWQIKDPTGHHAH
ncbi:DUF1264 domain-containing protein [Pseudomonas sp. NA13]